MNNSFVNPQLVKQKPNETAKLENQIPKLTKQVQMLVQNQRITCKSEQTEPKEPLAVNTRQPRPSAKVPGVPRGGFCFKPGEDNSIPLYK